MPSVEFFQRQLVLFLLLSQFLLPFSIGKFASSRHVFDLLLQVFDFGFVPGFHAVHFGLVPILDPLLLFLGPLDEKFFLNFELVFMI